MTPRRYLDLRAALRALPKAVGASVVMGVLLRTFLSADWRPAVAVPVIFTVVMWVGFELFGPFLAFRPDERLSPGAMAIREELASCPAGGNVNDDLFGYERVRDVFLRAASGALQGVVDALLAEADAFRGTRPLDDDVTLVTVAVR